LVHLGAGIGNIVLATPLIVALDGLGFRTDLWLSADYPETAALLRNWSLVDRIHVEASARGTRRSHLLVPAIPPFYWPRFSRAYRSWSRQVPRPPEERFYQNEQGYYLDFARALGWTLPSPPVYRLPIGPATHLGISSRTLALAPGCKTGEMSAKRWPGYSHLADRFEDVAVVGTPEDLRDANGRPLHFSSHVRVLTGQLTLRETVEALAAAGAVVGNDSGLSHAAAATGTPTLMLFGPTPNHELGPLPPNVEVLRSDLACEPCWFGERMTLCAGRVDCLAKLSVERVIEAVTRILGKAATREHRT